METPASGPRVDDAPVVVAPSTTPPDLPVVLGTTPDPPSGSRRRLVVALVAVLVVVVAAVAGWLLLRDDGGTASTRTPAANNAGGPVVPARLRIQVDAPAQVVAGAPATFVVHYTDGAGTFAGSTEDWGDAIGASSVSLGQCTAATPASAVDGTFTADHTWSTPGTYQVTLSAASYTCVDGSAVPEQVTKTLQVVVAAAS